jgi:protein TonB
MTLSLAGVGGTSGASSPLAWAFTASVALHLAFIAGLPDWWTHSPAPATASLNARLDPGLPPGGADAMFAAEPVARVAPERAAPPRERSERPLRQSAPVKQAATTLPIATRRPQALQHDIAETAEPVAPESPRQHAAAARAAGPAGALVDGEPTLAPRSGDEALDLGSLAQYRRALIGAAKRNRFYPEHAIERGWQGRVDVRLSFGADGGIAAARVRRSSGFDPLDRQALEMLRKAAALTPVPPALQSREFSVDVPVVFELKGAG